MIQNDRHFIVTSKSFPQNNEFNADAKAILKTFSAVELDRMHNDT